MSEWTHYLKPKLTFWQRLKEMFSTEVKIYEKGFVYEEVEEDGQKRT